MKHLVRLGFVRWLEGVVNEVRQNIAKALRRGKIEPQARADAYFGRVLPIDNSFAQRQIDDAVVHHARLNENAGYYGGNLVGLNEPA